MALWGSNTIEADEAAAGAALVGRRDGPPASAIAPSDGFRGLAGLVAAWLLVMALKPPVLVGAWIVLLATALPMLVSELRRAPPPQVRERGGSQWGLWLVGLLVATLPFVLLHAQGMGPQAWTAAWAVALPTLMLRLLIEARRNGALSVGFPGLLGQSLLARRLPPAEGLVPALRLWSLKAFFIPLYALSLYALIRLGLAAELSSPVAWLSLAVVLAYTIDLSFGLSGYLFASNDLAPTLRSTQPRLLGWIVCLACYGPIIVHWPAFKAVVQQEIGWPAALTASPLVLLAALAMVLLLVLYVWGSVSFGLRFSNLSNRGLVSHGPYRWMKHPAYFAHVANAWILCLILIPAAGVDLGWSQWLVPVAFTILYRMRAVTEEQHMSEDPAYRDYAAWIAQHGVLARLRALLGR